MSFNTLELVPELLCELSVQGLSEPTLVQRDTIPAVLSGRDVWVCAKTGSGKSLAYLLPLLSRKRRNAGALTGTVLIMVPTRELVHQLADVLSPFAARLPGFKYALLTGGSSINPQLMQLRGGVDMVLATPGRLLDVMRQGGLKAQAIDVLILDEADRLLDSGFAEDTGEVLEQVKPRQTVMLSATFSGKVNARAKWLLTEPVVIQPDEQRPNIHQRIIRVDTQQRTALLTSMIKDDQLTTPTVVFVKDRKTTERLAHELNNAGIRAEALHGKLSTQRRTQVLARLVQGSLQVLVATDLAARGIDIPVLPCVINYDLPRSADLYTHRIGRTGRAGESGMAISLVDISTQAHMVLIEKRVGITLEHDVVPGFEPTNTQGQSAVLTDGTGGIKGRRMSKKDKLRAAAASAVLQKTRTPNP